MPAAYRIIVLPEAFDDLDRITEYIKRESPQSAGHVLDLLWKSTQGLAILPNRYKVHQHRKDPSKVVRSMPVPPFVLYYRVAEETKVVRILTIRHGRQKQPRRFR